MSAPLGKSGTSAAVYHKNIPPSARKLQAKRDKPLRRGSMPIMVRGDKAPSTPVPLPEGQALSVSSDPQDDQNDEEFCHRRTRRCDDRSWPCQHHAGVKQGPEPWRPASLLPTAQMRHRATDPMRQRMSFVHGPRRERRGPLYLAPNPNSNRTIMQSQPRKSSVPCPQTFLDNPSNFPFWAVFQPFSGGKTCLSKSGHPPLEQRRKQTWRAIQ